MTPDTLWFAVAWRAAINGVSYPGTTPLPVLPSAIFLPVIIGGPLLLFSKRVGQVLDEIPASWLVALPRIWQLGSSGLAARCAARRVRVAGRHRRRADGTARVAGGDRSGRPAQPMARGRQLSGTSSASPTLVSRLPWA
jgi:hypothetical protein